MDPLLAETKYVGIKIDDYYKGLHEKVIPKAVDFIVAVDCECDWYVLYILELRNVKRTSSSKEIQEKFDTAINHFMKEEFDGIFLNDRFKYEEVFLYLVTTSYQRAVELGNFEKYQELRARLNAKDSLADDSTLTSKPYKFRGKCLNWEKGRAEPDIDTFVKLCNIYEIDCARLLLMEKRSIQMKKFFSWQTL